MNGADVLRNGRNAPRAKNGKSIGDVDIRIFRAYNISKGNEKQEYSVFEAQRGCGWCEHP